MKKIICLLIVIHSFINLKSQTNVSGGIFTNTTWSVAGSPYIVVDTLVVFPGVTLTIQPGVIVKFFDNKRIEVRQALINAIGTSNDSITFTSNSSNPSLGSWSGILIKPNSPNVSHNFSYCNFSFADNAITVENYFMDSIIIKHSAFRYNNSGIGNNIFTYIDKVRVDSSNFNDNLCGIGSFYNNPYGTRAFAKISNSDFSRNQQAGMVIEGSRVTNCIINSNQTGIFENGGYNFIMNCIIDSNSVQGHYSFESEGDTIKNCEVKFNGIGFYDETNNAYAANIFTENNIENNSIGIKSNHPQDLIFCNKICNNLTYDYYNNSSANLSIANNYWCTNDSAMIQNLIFDAHDNVSSGLVNFMPIDTIECTGISGFKNINYSNRNIEFFPNPTSGEIKIKLQKILSIVEVGLLNSIGQLIYSLEYRNIDSIFFEVPGPPGLYFINVKDSQGNSTVFKVIKE